MKRQDILTSSWWAEVWPLLLRPRGRWSNQPDALAAQRPRSFVLLKTGAPLWGFFRPA
jgi:hypothetical protein